MAEVQITALLFDLKNQIGQSENDPPTDSLVPPPVINDISLNADPHVSKIEVNEYCVMTLWLLMELLVTHHQKVHIFAIVKDRPQAAPRIKGGDSYLIKLLAAGIGWHYVKQFLIGWAFVTWLLIGRKKLVDSWL